MIKASIQKILKGLIKIYQWTLSPFFGSCCRFYPSCSNYGIEAIEKHGPIKGCWLTFKRILKCFPWHPGGHDPVPPKELKGSFPPESNHHLID